MRDYAFSIDLGGTTTNFSVFTDEIISEWTVPTPKDNLIDMVEDEILGEIARLKLESNDFKAIVIVIAGIVMEGIVVNAINLNLLECDFGGILKSRLNIEVIVLNDVNLQAIGESKNYSNLFLVAIGTGIGAGLILNNQLVEGHNGAAGEISHVYFGTKTPHENASARGLVKTTENYLKSHDDNSSLRDLKTFTTKDVFDHAKAGDEVSLKIIGDIYFRFGKMLAVITSAIDPEVIIISGGVSNAGDLLLDIIREGFNEVAFKNTEILISEMKEKATVYGAMKIVADL